MKEDFIVSARKYRPSSFSTVVGQRSITQTLKNAIKNNHLAHAYLFCGPRGVGKTSCARIFAKTINCFNISSDFEACNECESCKSFQENRSYNIHELDAASNNSVDDIRSLTDQVRILPQVGNYSIYIIDEVHMLSASAFNAFLKTLEEPPAHAIFVLATTEKHKILPTILSRCQIFDFSRIKVEDAVEYLKYVAQKEGVNIDEEALNVIAQKADGAMRDALSIFDQIVSFSGKEIGFQDAIQNLNVLDYDYYFKIVDAALNGKVSEILLLFNEILEKGFDGHHFVNGLSSHVRDVLVGKNEETIQLLELSEAIKQKYMMQAKQCSVDFLYEALQILNRCDIDYRNSQNPRLLVEIGLIQLAQIIELKKKENLATAKEPKLLKIDSEKKNNDELPSSLKPPVVSKEKKQQVELVNASNANFWPKQEKTTKAKSERSYSPSVSIKQALQSTEHQKPKKELMEASKQQRENLQEESHDNLPNFSAEEVMKHLNLFIRIKNKSERVGLALTVNEPRLLENKIVIAISNSLQEDDVKEVKIELQNYFRSLYRNDLLVVETEKNKAIRTKKLILDIDRYDYLREKNPALDVLKKKFALDFE